VVPDDDTAASGPKPCCQPAKSKPKAKVTKQQTPEPSSGDDEQKDTDGDPASEQEGTPAHGKGGRLPKMVILKVKALWDQLLEDMDCLGSQTGYAREMLMLAAGARKKNHCSPSSWNVFCSLQAQEHPQSKTSKSCVKYSWENANSPSYCGSVSRRLDHQ
jgi:hypothetical protein